MSTFLVLSDIHFGSLADNPDFITRAATVNAGLSNPRPMLDTLIETAKKTVGHFDGLLVPGDLTSTGKPSEFVECAAAIRKVADALGIPPSATYVTFGNHDVDWDISRLSEVKHESGAEPLYREVAARLGQTLVPQPPATYPGPLPGSGMWRTATYDVIVLNSGYECCHDQPVRNGNLGKQQREWLASLPSKEEGKWRLMMIHHHPMNLPYPAVMTDTSTLAEGAETLEEINRLGVDFVVHGHRHHPIVHTAMRHGWVRPVTFLCAGSVGVGHVHRLGGDIPNVFHIVEFTERAANNAASGIVHTFSFRTGTGWIPTLYTKETPIDPQRCFGACATEPEAKEELEQLLAAQTGGNPPSFRLPAFGSLSLNLRSLPSGQLNEIARDCLKQAGYTMFGHFPEPVIATK